MTASARRVLASGLGFLESPSWFDERIWVSDIARSLVLAIDPHGTTETIAHVPARPCGLGHLPDGRLLVVSMLDRTVRRLDSDELVVHSDLSGLLGCTPNDIVVGPTGNAYVGSPGFGSPLSTRADQTGLVLVRPDGSAEMQAGELTTPNGMTILPDAETLVVAETIAARLTAFTIRRDGRLTNQRTWATMHEGFVDGICADAEGAIWVADPKGKRCLRVVEGGRITDVIDTSPAKCVACTLAGPGRRLLALLVVDETDVPFDGNDEYMEHATQRRPARIETTMVSVPGAGWP
jgi:sugar lactone lactonase YvrE